MITLIALYFLGKMMSEEDRIAGRLTMIATGMACDFMIETALGVAVITLIMRQ